MAIGTYIALLRAINVNGRNLIKMSELKQMFERMGFGRVQTYIQSGNVLFQAEEEPEPLRRRIEQEIKGVFGLDVAVILRTADELAQIVRDCPFAGDELREGERLYVTLLADLPADVETNRLLAASGGVDEFRIAGREIYILYRQSTHKSKLSNHFFERKLGVVATTRNWQTMSKLVAMAAAMER